MDRVYYRKGDYVVFVHELEGMPKKMVVIDIPKTNRRDIKDKSFLLGIKCCWFTTTGEYQEHKFNTKDLKHYEK